MEKKVYTIDVSNIPPEEIDEYMEKISNKMKKVPYVSPEEMEKLGYGKLPKLTRWQKIKKWFGDFAAHGDFTGI